MRLKFYSLQGITFGSATIDKKRQVYGSATADLEIYPLLFPQPPQIE